jgi:hypothetical protein
MQNAAFNTPNPAAGGRVGNVIYEGFGPGRCNCSYNHNYPYVFGPRLGAAYQINAKTVLRLAALTGEPYVAGNVFGNAPIVWPDFSLIIRTPFPRRAADSLALAHACRRSRHSFRSTAMRGDRHAFSSGALACSAKCEKPAGRGVLCRKPRRVVDRSPARGTELQCPHARRTGRHHRLWFTRRTEYRQSRGCGAAKRSHQQSGGNRPLSLIG